jgi:hypothetical protein
MTVTENASLDARYGRTPKKRKRDRRIYVIGAIAIAAVMIAWVIWGGLDSASASLDAEDAGATIVNPTSVRISYQISMPVGKTARCALQVQNAAHSIIGWKVVDVPASKGFTNTYSTIVKSAEKPDGGSIYECWAT